MVLVEEGNLGDWGENSRKKNNLHPKMNLCRKFHPNWTMGKFSKIGGMVFWTINKEFLCEWKRFVRVRLITDGPHIKITKLGSWLGFGGILFVLLVFTLGFAFSVGSFNRCWGNDGKSNDLNNEFESSLTNRLTADWLKLNLGQLLKFRMKCKIKMYYLERNSYKFDFYGGGGVLEGPPGFEGAPIHKFLS